MSTINTQHSDKWSINFSNIPGYIPSNRNNLNNQNIYDLYVKSVSFPSYSIKLTASDYKNHKINHQISKQNDDFSDLSVTFKLSEGMLNYFYIFRWMRSIREGINIDSEDWFRLNFIKAITIHFLDNEKRPCYKYVYENCFITNLSDLNLTNGEDEQLTFTINLTYEELKVEEETC
jgi:hypothetical protein